MTPDRLAEYADQITAAIDRVVFLAPVEPAIVVILQALLAEVDAEEEKNATKQWLAMWKLAEDENDRLKMEMEERDKLQITVEALTRANGWQDISTAPKDGTEILVYCPHGFYVVQWGTADIDWWAVDDNKHGPFPLRGAAPTHWMPLPPAPSAGDGGRG